MCAKKKSTTDKKAMVKKHIKLGDLLIQAGLIDDKTLREALDVQRVQKKKLGEVLMDMGILDDVDIANALASQLKIPFLRLEKIRIPNEVIDLIPREMAQQYKLVPLKKAKNGLVVAIANPLEFYAQDDLRFATQMSIMIVVSPLRDILDAIQSHYPETNKSEVLTHTLGGDVSMEVVQRKDAPDKGDQDLLNLAELPPVVRFTNAIIADAIRMKASDIHIEPRKRRLIIRCRVDGIMHETLKTDKHVHASVVSRLKVISNLDISIRRKPQDGKAQVKYDERIFDLRVSTIPTSYGEKVTLRILNPSTAEMNPEDIGLCDKDLEHLLDAITKPQGAILVTGPTGSGKSSTLYACLNKLNTPLVNIVTVEDPVEFDVEGINQVQINPKAGITFAAGLRSILRQDPDIVMLGEIRDAETAGTAFQAAQTGHLVLSTLHTNDAPSAVTRLLDLGIDDFQISAALEAVLGQRLVRRIHPECKVACTPEPKMLERLHPYIGKDPGNAFKGAGCNRCHGTGYSGRMGVFELLIITPALKPHITSGVSAQALKAAGETDGFRGMTADGVEKAFKGLTSLEEVFRVVPPEYQPVSKAQPGICDTGKPACGGKTGIRRDPANAFPPAEIWLGAPQAEEPPVFAADETPPFSDPKNKVLVVDDSAITRKVLCNALEMENYDAIEAGQGKEGMKRALKEKPDLIVTDFQMPEMDGMALIKALKSQPRTSRIPIIMLTAVDDVTSEVEVFDAGADDYLTKPVNPKRFLARVKRFINPPANA